MRNYWPLPVFFLILLAIVGMSHYADHSKREYDDAHAQVEGASVAKDQNNKASDHANKPYKPPVWAKYVTFPEGLGAWAVVLTLFAIVWQSIETRKAAEAANRQTEIQRESLRPRLGVGNLVKDLFSEALNGGWVTVNLKLSNCGGMPAYNVRIDTWIEFISGLPPYQFTTEARFRQARPMNVVDGSGFFIPLNRELTEDERHKMAKFTGAICFRVRLNYLAFGKDVHTDEAFVLRPGEMETIPEYTSAT